MSFKNKFEVLCVTMHQKDFSKINEMNIHSNVVFANQADRTDYDETEIEGKCVRMITTATRGVGINRNLTLTYANADICLFADDDVTYCDNMEEIVLAEFSAHPDADVIIFHVDAGEKRKQISYPKTKKCRGFFRMPWGAVRIAFRLNSVKKANLWFTTLFGGGCIFPSGEDSIWLRDAKRKGLTFYVSKETIGKTDVEDSTWFTGYDEKFFFGKGASICALYNRWSGLLSLYYLFRYRKAGELSLSRKMKWIKIGRKCYANMVSFDEYKKTHKID